MSKEQEQADKLIEQYKEFFTPINYEISEPLIIECCLNDNQNIIDYLNTITQYWEIIEAIDFHTKVRTILKSKLK